MEEQVITAPAHFGRFKGAPWFEVQTRSALIGGAGGIGSWLTLFLSRANFECIVFDMDTVETHNTGGQLYGGTHIGVHKVQALDSVIKYLAQTPTVPFNAPYNEKSLTHYYCFSCFDNMEARKLMFSKWKAKIPFWTAQGMIPIFIDGRLRAEQMQIFCVTSNTIAEYEKHLFSSTEVEPEACTMKQTSHSAAMIGAHMTAFFTNHLTNVKEQEDIREVPFYWSYFIPLDLVTIEPPVYDTHKGKETD